MPTCTYTAMWAMSLFSVPRKGENDSRRRNLVGLADIAEQLIDIESKVDDLTDPDNGQARFSIAKAHYDKVDERSQSQTARTAIAGGYYPDAAGDITVQGQTSWPMTIWTTTATFA